jgi:hypothetical protein
MWGLQGDLLCFTVPFVAFIERMGHAAVNKERMNA